VVAASSRVSPTGVKRGHVVPLGRSVHGALQRLDVGHIYVVDVDAFLGEERGQLA
jgi:hypothetical protein